MTRAEAISQLKSLITDRQSFIEPGEPDSIYQADIEALKVAIAALSAAPQREEREAKEWKKQLL